MPTTYFPCRWMVGTFQEILDSSSGNWVRIKSITDLRVLAFVGSTEAKYSSTDLIFRDFISFRFSKLVVEGHGPSTSKIPKGQVQEWRQTEPRGRSLEVLQPDAWMAPITLNVAHVSPTKSSAR